MNVYEYLLNYNIKPSVQRIAIMDYLLKHHTHPCIDEIYMALHDDIPTLSKPMHTSSANAAVGFSICQCI